MALDPNREIDEFRARALRSQQRYQRLSQAIELAPDRSALRKGLAVDAVFRLGVEWELLQHRWYVAAIARDPSKLISSNLDRIRAIKVQDQLRDVFNVSVDHRSPTRLKQAEIERLVDPQDRNIGFTDMQAWRTAATRDLAPTYIERVCRLADDLPSSSLLDLLKGMRDYIAHNSRDASRRLNKLVSPRGSSDRIGLAGVVNSPLARASYGVRDLGTYLNRDLGYPATNRVDFIHDRVLYLAETLRTP